MTTVFSYQFYGEQHLQKRLHEQTEAEEQLRDRLDQIVSLQLEDKSPLRSWLAEFTKQTQIPVELVKDPAASPRPDLSLDLPITLPLSPLPAHEWLQVLGELYEVNWRMGSDGIVVLINKDSASNAAHHLQHYPPLVQPNLTLAEQSDLVTILIDPRSWYDVGGFHLREQSTTGLLALQSHQNHRRMAKFLRRLGEAYQRTTALPVAGLSAADPAWEPIWLDGDPQHIVKLQQALERPITLRVIDMPVDDFAELLTKQAGFPVIMHPRDFFEPDQTRFLVTVELKGVPLKHALREWKSVGVCDFQPAAGGRLLVVFDRKAHDGTPRETLFVYPVQDLKINPRGEVGGAYLIDLLSDVIEPETWVNDAGIGQGISTSDGKLLLVSQTLENHRRIQEFLQQLRRVQNCEARTAMCKPDPPLPVRSAELELRLNRSMSFYFCGVADVRAFEEICIRGDIRLPRLEENGFVGSGRLWCNLPAQPLRDNLELLFAAKGHDLQYLEQVANPEEKPIEYDDSKLLVTEIFDLRPWLTAGNTTLSVDELVRKVIHPETWSDNGGTGQAIIFRDSLVVRSHPRVMGRVRDLLAALNDYSTVGQAKQWRGQSLTGEALNQPLEMWGPNDPAVVREQKFAARDAEINEKLKQRVSVNIQKKEIRAALLDLAREYQLPMILQELPSLWNGPGADPFGGLSTRGNFVSFVANDGKVSIEARDQPLGEVLQQLIGDPAQLVWLIKDGHLTVTSPAFKFVDQTPGHLYCVDDLIMPRGPLRPRQLIRTLEVAVRDTDGDGDLTDESQTDPQDISLEFHFGNLLWFNQDQSDIDRTRVEAVLRDLRSGKLKPVEALEGDSDYYKLPNRGPRRNGCYSTIPVVGMNSPAEVRR